MAAARTKTVAGQPCWVIRSDEVELNVTQLGGHMAPVTFFRNSRRPIQPYYLSPWQGEGLKIDGPVLVPLRGDFFCMPFGGNEGSKNIPAHGQTAGQPWTLDDAGRSSGVTTLLLRMDTSAPKGTVARRLQLIDGHNAVYQQNLLSGYSCRTTLGHHATLAVPEKPGALRLATSPIQFGQTNPEPTDDPAAGEYASLEPDQRFEKLSRVPLRWKDPAWGDFTAYPAREGFTDILGVFNKPTRTPAWTTATVDSEGYLWFSLKDPAVLPTTLIWVSNKGRHMTPWNGRNRCLGLEDICGHFADGVPKSARANALSRAGIPTAVKLSPKTPLAVNYIQGVAQVPRGFGKVRTVKFTPGTVTFTGLKGKKVDVPVCHEFLRSGELAE